MIYETFPIFFFEKFALGICRSFAGVQFICIFEEDEAGCGLARRWAMKKQSENWPLVAGRSMGG